MYREGKLIYQIGVMYKDADTDTVKYSYADLAKCYDGKGTTNGIVNGELIPKFVVSPEVNILPVITGANIALGESITMNYYVKLGLENTNAKLKVTMNDKVTYLGAQTSSVGGFYKFAFEGIAPQCMGDKIKAELIVDGEVVGVKDGYSVLDNVTSKNVMNDSSKTLIADLLAYGAAAQNYVDYKTNALVNKGYESLATTVNAIAGDYMFTQGTATDASFANVSHHQESQEADSRSRRKHCSQAAQCQRNQSEKYMQGHPGANLLRLCSISHQAQTGTGSHSP